MPNIIAVVVFLGVKMANFCQQFLKPLRVGNSVFHLEEKERIGMPFGHIPILSASASFLPICSARS